MPKFFKFVDSCNKLRKILSVTFALIVSPDYDWV